MKAQDPDCLQRQFTCKKNRDIFLKGHKKIPKEFTTLYSKLQQYKDNVAVASLKARDARKTSDFYQREFDRTSNIQKVVEEEKKVAERSLVDARSILATEACILDAYKVSKKLSNHFVIDSVSFEHTLPILKDVRLDISIKVSFSINVILVIVI